MTLLAAAVFALSACSGKRLTKANVDEVSNGMSQKQVESILGPPTSVDSKDLLVTKKVTYIYRQANESVTIVFFRRQGGVEGKQPARLAIIRGDDDDDERSG